MRGPLLVLLFLHVFLSSCAGSSFSGASNSANQAPTGTADAIPQAPPTNAPAVTDQDSGSELSPCLEALGGVPTEVIDVTQGDIDQIPAGAVLEIKASGQSLVDLSAIEVSQLRGLCIYASGQADLEVDLSSSLGGIYYYGRGGARVSVDFGAQATIDRLVTDISGSSTISLIGAAIDCNALNIEAQGSSQVECNGL